MAVSALAALAAGGAFGAVKGPFWPQVAAAAANATPMTAGMIRRMVGV